MEQLAGQLRTIPLRLRRLKKSGMRKLSRTDGDSRFLPDRRGFTLGYTATLAVSDDHFGEGPTKVATGTFHELETPKYTAEDFRFTTKGDDLYVIGLSLPANGEVLIHSLAASVASEPVLSLSLLGSDAKVPFEQHPDGLHVKLPPEAPTKYAYVLRVSFARSSH